MSTASTKLNTDDITVVTDGLIFNPYNSNNTEITEKYIQTILSDYGVPPTITNLELYKRAFVHRSYIKRPIQENEKHNITLVERPYNCIPLGTKSNERLEFLGDGVLECITKYYLYRRFPKENEGFMTEKKIALVKNEAIGKIALEMGLHRKFIISKHAEDMNFRTNIKKLGCLFESFIGALFLDFNKLEIRDEDAWFKNLFVTGPGFQMAQIFIENVFERHVDWTELINNDDNYKNILQVKIQKEFKVTPHYIEIPTDEIPNDPPSGNNEYVRKYNMGVYLCLGQSIHNVSYQDAIDFKTLDYSFNAVHSHMETHGNILICLGTGVHSVKRKAEQLACSIAIDSIDNMSR